MKKTALFRTSRRKHYTKNSTQAKWRVEYDVQVRAVSASGDGSWSATLTGTTIAGDGVTSEPTPTSTPEPPVDECVGAVSGNGAIPRSWSSECASGSRSGRYAKGVELHRAALLSICRYEHNDIRHVGGHRPGRQPRPVGEQSRVDQSDRAVDARHVPLRRVRGRGRDRHHEQLLKLRQRSGRCLPSRPTSDTPGKARQRSSTGMWLPGPTTTTYISFCYLRTSSQYRIFAMPYVS